GHGRVEGLEERVAELRRRIAAAGGRDVRLVAVTKGFGPDHLRAARAAGLDDIGENYAQELLAKAQAAPASTPGLRWHFLGTLQRRRVRDLAGLVALWQSVDRLALGHAIARHAPGAAVLVQVNVSDRPGRGGCTLADAPGLVVDLDHLGLSVRGLMAVGDPDAPRPGFRRLAQLGRSLGLQELSMGMSADLEVGVEEGATMVRVGRALFGPRPAGADLRRYPHSEGGW
ncbi:MAG: YggS family pyridoxal phosphate enzyme, partial [Acidimicrobiales bacterium]